jgi:serine/threonine protein kinase
LHKNNIIHRDLKPENILVNKDLSSIKISDFGFAIMLNGEKLTSEVFSYPYTPPELIFANSCVYRKESDIWSIGCIFGELLINKLYVYMFDTTRTMEGDPYLNSLKKIFKFSGFPSEDVLNKYYIPNLTEEGKQIFKNLDKESYKKCELGNTDAEELLSRLLDINPEMRITAEDALKHRFFNE